MSDEGTEVGGQRSEVRTATTTEPSAEARKADALTEKRDGDVFSPPSLSGGKGDGDVFTPPLIRISHLDFAYGPRLVLKHVNLDVATGETLGLIGPNGGGKTTLLKLLLGLQTPTRGSITIDGMPPPTAIGRGDVVGYLPQRPHVPGNFPMSVRQVVRQGLVGKTRMLRGFARDDVAFAESLLERVGVRDLADEPIGQLSGGQQQRAFIARAVAARPKLLLLDEPTTGIDASAQQKFIEFLQDLRRALNLTVVFTSHDLRAVASLSDRIACLNVTLHAHDVPERVPADVVYGMFACDVDVLRKREPRPNPA